MKLIKLISVKQRLVSLQVCFLLLSLLNFHTVSRSASLKWSIPPPSSPAAAHLVSISVFGWCSTLSSYRSLKCVRSDVIFMLESHSLSSSRTFQNQHRSPGFPRRSRPLLKEQQSLKSCFLSVSLQSFIYAEVYVQKKHLRDNHIASYLIHLHKQLSCSYVPPP